MDDFGELIKVPLREIWAHEANDFTPWLAENIEALGNALGLELELTSREASVGGFSLDLLAEDLGSSKTVIVENQLSQTDHDHLGKLLTYAAGFDASIVIWICEEVREEHRQALDWLNQRTDINTQFFAVVVVVLKVDDSKPAFDFNLVVSPNEWQKSKRQGTSTNLSPKAEQYKSYFQALIDELVESYDFTGSYTAQSRNYYQFSSGFQKIYFDTRFTQKGRVRAAIYINLDLQHENQKLFDALRRQETEITSEFGSGLEWEGPNERKHSTISVYRDGDIESSDGELEEIRKWHIENLLKLKEVFTPEIERALEEIELTSVPQ